MQLRSLSVRTQEAYVGAAAQLSQHYGKSPEQIGKEELREYFPYTTNVKRVSTSSCTVALCGIKFLYQQTLQRTWPMLKFDRPAHVRRLPVVLSVEEVGQV